jgi:hypothetical protein
MQLYAIGFHLLGGDTSDETDELRNALADPNPKIQTGAEHAEGQRSYRLRLNYHGGKRQLDSFHCPILG